MKIIILGGGIAGLSAYLALQKHLSNSSQPVTIKVYESHLSPSSEAPPGGGLGIAPNGLRALASVSKKAAEYIQSHGFARAIMTFRNSAGVSLGEYYNGREERYGFSQVLLRRSVVHEALLGDISEGTVDWGKKAISVREVEDSVEVEFSDHTTDKADLVIGADGVKSIARQGIYGQEHLARYEGYTGVGGFLPISSLSPELREGLKKDPVTMTFGAQGFFGYSIASPNVDDDTATLMWWSTYEAVEPPRPDAPLTEIYSQLIARHAAWKSPYDSSNTTVFKSIITLACQPVSSSSSTSTGTAAENNILILPRYVLDPLPRWSSLSGTGRIILLGDAAHAMPPDAGQGVSCAAEDAVALGLLLKHYYSTKRFDVKEALEQTATGYEEVRMGRVSKILEMAKRRGDNKKMKSWSQELLRDWMITLLCKLPEAINDRVFAHDVGKEVDDYLERVHADFLRT